MPQLSGAKRLFIGTRVGLEHGELPSIEIEYETWGRLSEARDNAILICPAFSAHSHARSHEDNPEPGWWEEMIGPGRAFDSSRFFVVCASLLGGSCGTTGPLSTNPETGRAYGPEFPIISIRDIVDVQVRLLDHLGLERLFAVAGGSMGAMEAIDLAVRYPRRVRLVIAMSGTARTQPYTATIRHVGRQAILLDPSFQDGHYEGAGPRAGLRLARELGTIYYRSRQDFNTRFSCTPRQVPSLGASTFDFQSYLTHMGNKIVGKFDANAYLRLSLAMDLHDVSRGFKSLEQALGQVEAEFFTMGVEEDLLIPIEEQEGLHRALLESGVRSTWHTLSSRFGHDAFLKEFDWMTPRIREFLRSPVPAVT
ncbi:MAG: homoserine O-acetyltransferase [Acidobacteriota bacterium]